MCEWLLLSTISVVLVPTLPVAKHLPFASLALDVPRPGGRARRHMAPAKPSSKSNVRPLVLATITCMFALHHCVASVLGPLSALQRVAADSRDGLNCTTGNGNGTALAYVSSQLQISSDPAGLALSASASKGPHCQNTSHAMGYTWVDMFCRARVASGDQCGPVLPGPLWRYEPLVRRIARLGGGTRGVACWTVDRWEADIAWPRIAVLHPADRVVRINSVLLALVPPEPPTFLVQWYERLHGLLRSGGDISEAAETFWRAVGSGTGGSAPVPRAIECSACIVLLSFAGLARSAHRVRAA